MVGEARMTRTQRKKAPLGRQGRQSRQAARAAKTPGIIAGARREIPPYDLVKDEGLEIIEAHAEDILQEIGVEFRGDHEALRLWREAGAEVNTCSAGWVSPSTGAQPKSPPVSRASSPISITRSPKSSPSARRRRASARRSRAPGGGGS